MLLLIFCLSACNSTTQELSGLYEAGSSFMLEVDGKPSGVDSLTNRLRVSQLQLNLQDDHQADLYMSVAEGPSPLVLRGSWIKSSRDQINVYLVERNGQFYRDTLSLQRKAGQLVLEDAQFGSVPIDLYKQLED